MIFPPALAPPHKNSFSWAKVSYTLRAFPEYPQRLSCQGFTLSVPLLPCSLYCFPKDLVTGLASLTAVCPSFLPLFFFFPFEFARFYLAGDRKCLSLASSWDVITQVPPQSNAIGFLSLVPTVTVSPELFQPRSGILAPVVQVGPTPFNVVCPTHFTSKYCTPKV